MIAVIFEVWPAAGRAVEYFDLAAALRPDLEKIDGFISIERFESLTNKGKYLSLSFWRDEEAIRTWRNLEGHRKAQAKGRGGVFADAPVTLPAALSARSPLHREEGMRASQLDGAERGVYPLPTGVRYTRFRLAR